jgi:hypothetical protein
MKTQTERSKVYKALKKRHPCIQSIRMNKYGRLNYTIMIGSQGVEAYSKEERDAAIKDIRELEKIYLEKPN